jgi:uncharacterized protein YndB with AHSA1/START domain
MTDLNAFAAGVSDTEREIGSRRIAAGEARTILMRRRYDAPIEDVWDACTDPDRLDRWFLHVSGDLRAGGTFDIQDNAHGEILRCEPPRVLTLSWRYEDRPYSEVELRLSPGAAGGTVLELEHGFAAKGYLVGVGVGWEAGLYALGPYLRDELPDVPAAEQAGGPPAGLEELLAESEQLWVALVGDVDTPVGGHPADGQREA